jgi:hypothetical protein
MTQALHCAYSQRNPKQLVRKGRDTDLHKLAEELRVKAGNRTTNADLTIG